MCGVYGRPAVGASRSKGSMKGCEGAGDRQKGNRRHPATREREREREIGDRGQRVHAQAMCKLVRDPQVPVGYGRRGACMPSGKRSCRCFDGKSNVGCIDSERCASTGGLCAQGGGYVPAGAPSSACRPQSRFTSLNSAVAATIPRQCWESSASASAPNNQRRCLSRHFAPQLSARAYVVPRLGAPPPPKELLPNVDKY